MQEESNGNSNIDSGGFVGTDWVDATVLRFCSEASLPAISTSWQTDSNDLFVSLTIIANDGRRVSKLFSRYELVTCANNPIIQTQLTERIIHLLKILHPERKRQSH